jgi:PHD/YefM family antitoxin component YafN of YafNO toxin-antitoxin module
MAFTSKGEPIIKVKEEPQEPIIETSNPTPLANQLNAAELELLLTVIKRSQFLGEHVELVYNTTVKIQNQFLERTK